MKNWTSDQIKVCVSQIIAIRQMWVMILLLSLDIEGSMFDTLLADRVIYEQITMVQMLLKKGANVNIVIIREFTRSQSVPLLYLRLWDHNIKIIHLLLAYGADINQTLQGWHKNYFTLHWAVYSDNMPLFKLMLWLSADVNRNVSDDWESTPLHLAANADDIRMTQLLLDWGANIDAQAVNSELDLTPLHWVLESKNDNLTQSEMLLMIKFLLRNGAMCQLEKDWSSLEQSFAQWIIAHSACIRENIMNVLLTWEGDTYDSVWLNLWKWLWENTPAWEYPMNQGYKHTYSHIDDDNVLSQ